MKDCDMQMGEEPKVISKKSAMKEILKELAGEMFQRMQAGKGESPMAGKDVQKALDAAGEGEGDEAMEAMTSGEEMDEGTARPRPKVMEVSAIKMGLLKPKQLAKEMGKGKKGRK